MKSHYSRDFPPVFPCFLSLQLSTTGSNRDPPLTRFGGRCWGPGSVLFLQLVLLLFISCTFLCVRVCVWVREPRAFPAVASELVPAIAIPGSREVLQHQSKHHCPQGFVIGSVSFPVLALSTVRGCCSANSSKCKQSKNTPIFILIQVLIFFCKCSQCLLYRIYLTNSCI